MIKTLNLSKFYLMDSVLKDFFLCEGYVPFQTEEYYRKAIPAVNVYKKQKELDSLWSKLNPDKPTHLWVVDKEYSLVFDVFAFLREGSLWVGEQVQSDKVSQLTLQRLNYRVWCLQRLGHHVYNYTVMNKTSLDVLGIYEDFDPILMQFNSKAKLDKFKDVIAGLQKPLLSASLCPSCFRRTHCSHPVEKDDFSLLEDPFLTIGI